MKHIAKYPALISLVILIAPPVLFLTGRMELESVKTVMLWATVLWFVAATVWMWRENNRPS